jgi:hypothetical protein
LGVDLLLFIGLDEWLLPDFCNRSRVRVFHLIRGDIPRTLIKRHEGLEKVVVRCLLRGIGAQGQ